eukprot:TRINITY_DN0_c878_g1_i1.p1 TRINITY_DN0_c878_g1~~TRINITY_DN0_c878_g1_i1.p1  ORF type:complete len:133 (-),score=30.85 TRINITY_DN0_c878_g1_i1:62-460(-)
MTFDAKQSKYNCETSTSGDADAGNQPAEETTSEEGATTEEEEGTTVKVCHESSDDSDSGYVTKQEYEKEVKESNASSEPDYQVSNESSDGDEGYQPESVSVEDGINVKQAKTTGDCGNSNGYSVQCSSETVV